jgi:glucose/arabinose dehydrogenase
MQGPHLMTVMTVFAWVWAVGAVWALFQEGRKPRLASIVYAATSLVVVIGVLWVGSVMSTRNSIFLVVENLLASDPNHLCAAALGLSLGLGPAMWPWQPRWTERSAGLVGRIAKAAGFVSILMSFGFLALLTLQDTIKKYFSWSHSNVETVMVSSGASTVGSDVLVDEFFKFPDIHPVQIAVGPDGALYACYQDGLGGVSRLTRDPKTGQFTTTVIAENLNRVFGLALHGRDLYVSRSGRHSKAQSGAIREANTGAVTLLRDLNGDGVMDYYHDVIPDLPGAQAPDPLHQNNGVVVGPDGYLYVAVGTHGNLAPAFGMFDGTIVRSRLDGSNVMVFARGMRNPFDCAFGPDSQIFCTDNDVGFGRTNEFNHVVQGGHYGHPYVAEGAPPSTDSIAPIWLHDSTLQGLAYTSSPNLPPAYRDRMYVVSYGSGEIHKVSLAKAGNTYKVERSLLTVVCTDAVDIAIGPDGTMYVNCFESQKILRLRVAQGKS